MAQLCKYLSEGKAYSLIEIESHLLLAAVVLPSVELVTSETLQQKSCCVVEWLVCRTVGISQGSMRG